MIAATRRWFRRNRTNIAIGVGVIGAGYVAGQYVLSKIQETRQRISEDNRSKENLRRRFEQNQEDCTYTILCLLPTIREEIIGALPVEEISEQLQQQRNERLRRLGASEAASSELPSGPPSVTDDASSLQSSSFIHASQMAGSSTAEGISASLPKRSKAQLWQDLKINSIARSLTLLYTLSLLTLLTRIQLNLLGRRHYLSSVVAMAQPPPPTQASTISLENKDDDNYDNVYGDDFETNRRYLTFSWWLLHRGNKQIMERVKAAVKEVFGGVNIREDVSFERLADLIMQVRKKIEGATENERRYMKWLDYLLPPKDEESFVIRQYGMSDSEESPSPEARAVDDPMTASAVEASAITPTLRRLLDETADLIDSPTFTHVLTRLLDATFSHLIDYKIATEAYKSSGPAAPGIAQHLPEERVQEIVDSKCKLAHILPVFSKQAHDIAAGSGDPDAIGRAATEGIVQNEYLAALDNVRELGAFAAVIYSSNFEFEVAESASTTSGTQSEAGRPSPSQLATLDPTAEVEEAEPRAVADRILEESGIVLAPDVAQERAASGPEQTAGAGGFEAAWKKALAAEDGDLQPAREER